MAGRFLGSTPIQARYRGSQRINARYLGDTLIWTSSRIFLPFSGENTDLANTSEWEDLGPATDYRAATHDGTLRLDLPDGLIVQMHRTSRARYIAAQHPFDDGFIEAVPATRGNGTPPIFGGATYRTDLLRRASNTGPMVSSAGIRLRESRLFIVAHVLGITWEMVDCGSFAANDRIRLEQVGDIHTMFRNGQIVGVWNDEDQLASRGPDFRSLLIRVDASKDLLGPRRFSPAIDTLECG